MIRKLIFLQDSISGKFYDELLNLVSLNDAKVYTEENYTNCIKFKVDDYKFYLRGLGDRQPVWKSQLQGVERKELPNFGIIPIAVTVLVDGTVADYSI